MLLVLVVLLHDLVGLPAPLREAFKEEVALLMGEAGIAIQITDCAAGRTGLNRKECIEPTPRACPVGCFSRTQREAPGSPRHILLPQGPPGQRIRVCEPGP